MAESKQIQQTPTTEVKWECGRCGAPASGGACGHCGQPPVRNNMVMQPQTQEIREKVLDDLQHQAALREKLGQAVNMYRWGESMVHTGVPASFASVIFVVVGTMIMPEGPISGCVSPLFAALSLTALGYITTAKAGSRIDELEASLGVDRK